MEHAHSLIVLTLLQLCLAEIPNAAPRWYAVNLINDSNYSPKPITEIFSAQNTFPPDNPVIVLQSTQSPITQDIVGTTPPTTWSTGTTNTQSTSYTQTQFPRILSDQNIQGSTEDPSTQLTQSTVPYPTTNLRADLTSILGNVYQTSQSQSYSPFQTTPPTVAVTPSTVQTWLPTQSTTPPPVPTSDWTTLSTSSPIPQLNRETYNTLPPYVPTLRSNVPFNQPQGQANGKVRPCDLNGVNPKPTYNASSPTLLSPIPKPILTIRLKAPRGSITNLHINPSTTTTTKKPTTTRRRKSPKGKNDYEICLDSCKGRKDPICASPLGVLPIDSNTLKGFPSLCHMACHNSFRKQPSYDKVADGRCGRLRTRIRTVEKNKIKREDLNKAQYTVSHSGPETVVEFSSLKR
ncbi:mucin-5AC-like [Zerene cesonia]|uniref:mucin-5AC-like n=1 Tax=Zerene cesonia TaxID=33412 RepID=UPI0018E53F72|nr:mucin-5AC-like [Zerene cesonia]